MATSFKINESALKQLLAGPDGPVWRDIRRRSNNVQKAARRLCPVDTGRLRASISVEMRIAKAGPVGRIGTNVKTACILGSHANVPTSNGPKTIGQVVPGDKVLTATGEWREVLKTNRFPVTEKPDLVTLSYQWHKGKNHELILTLDHKVPSLRSDGRIAWLPAGALADGDFVFVRRKLAHNKGTGKSKTCSWCQKIHFGQGHLYCSQQCRDKHWATGADQKIGRPRPPHMQAILRANREKGRGINVLAAWRRHNGGTDVERRVEGWLIGRGVTYEKQVCIGRHWVDFWLPETDEVIEADSAYWHQDQKRDIERDEALLETLGSSATITHIHFHDARFSPILDPEPMSGVRYVTVNPSVESYVEPSVFETVRVEIEKYRWQPIGLPRLGGGARVPNLYDLTVEGVHSFTVAGLLVSNSWVHEGTGIYAGKGRIYPKNGKVLAWKSNKYRGFGGGVFTRTDSSGKALRPGKGGMMFARSIKGMKGRPFLRNALPAANL